MTWPLIKIISGGQTGADQAGLVAGRQLGYRTGGCVPKGCRTEAGPNVGLVEDFGCHEHASTGYLPRTYENIRSSTGTVVFGSVTEIRESGTKHTWKTCLIWQVPVLAEDERVITPGRLRAWVIDKQIEVLNVAGHRESVSPGMYQRVLAILLEGLIQ